MNSLRTMLMAAAAASVLVSSAAADPVPTPKRALTVAEEVQSLAEPQGRPAPLEALFRAGGATEARWLPDSDTILYSTNAGGKPDLWLMRLSTGEVRRLTDTSGPKNALQVSPAGDMAIFQADVDGLTVNDLYMLRLETGATPVNLTNTSEISEGRPVFAPGGRLIAMTARDKTASSDNLALFDRDTGRQRRLTDEKTDGAQWMPVAFSADGGRLLASRYDFSMAFGEAYLIDVSTGEAQRLTPEGFYGFGVDLSPDGAKVALTLENDRGVRQAALYDVARGATDFIEASEWEQKPTAFSPDGRELLFITNVDGRQVISAYDLQKATSRRLALPDGVNAQQGFLSPLPAYSPDGKRILFPHASGARSPDYWVYDLGRDLAEKVTSLGGLEAYHLPPTRIVSFASRDGTVISGVLWAPHNQTRDGQGRGVILAHGGPTGQQLDAFDRTAAALASRGYWVLAPNFRGSTGYGQAFTNANRFDLGGGDLEDTVAGAEFLVQTGYVHPRRVGITGGSYGGYMTLMALARHPDVFSAGVNLFGVVNWRTMWERGTPPNRRYQIGLVGEPDTHPDVYDRASPLTYLEQLKAPLLVLQGENDPVVPAQESRQVVDFLAARDRTVDSRFYEGEGHGFQKRESQMDAMQRTIDWFDRYLK
jgi:dipeptidyl aminopeptidase/acylaminoacyl peptidase